MLDRAKLEELYRKYNQRKYVSPDPLQFLYDYPDVADREIVGLVASSLAYGRVAQILRSVATVLAPMGPSPSQFLRGSSARDLRSEFAGFKHRFTTDSDLVSLLLGVRRIISVYGSLNECFTAGLDHCDSNVLPALERFVGEISPEGSYLVPRPSKGSACKRLNLFLRWMARNDSVDPGGWTGIPPGKLLLPLDTHIATLGRSLSLTQRKSANMAMALEITSVFKTLAPEDPVKYDFALTRFGIRSELSIQSLLEGGDERLSAKRGHATRSLAEDAL